MVQVARKRKRVTDVTKKKTYGTINKCNEFIYQICLSGNKEGHEQTNKTRR